MAGPPLGVHVGVSFSWANAFRVDLKGDKEEQLFLWGGVPQQRHAHLSTNQKWVRHVEKPLVGLAKNRDLDPRWRLSLLKDMATPWSAAGFSFKEHPFSAALIRLLSPCVFQRDKTRLRGAQAYVDPC